MPETHLIEKDKRPIPKKGLERIQYLVEAYKYHWQYREEQLEVYRANLHMRMGKQWSDDDIAELDKANKPHLTFNHIGRLVDLLTGYERANRKRVLARPVDDDDIDDSHIISQTLRYVDDRSKAEHEKSQAFDDAATMGEGILGWAEDLEEGEHRVVCESVFSHVPDRECMHRLWANSAWHSRKKWMSRNAIRNAWPERLAEIEEMNPSYGYVKIDNSIEWKGANAYEGFPTVAGSHTSWAGDYDIDRLPEDRMAKDKTDQLGIFYREEVDKFLVIETYERVFIDIDVICEKLSDNTEMVIEEVPWIIDENTGRLKKQDDYLNSFASGLKNFYTKTIKRPQVRLTVWAGDVILEDGFTIHTRIPFVPYFWFMKHDGIRKWVQGFIDRMIDAQVAYNKSKSQEQHMINTSTGFILLLNKNLMRGIRPDTFEAALRNFNAVITVESQSMQEGVDYALLRPDNFPVQIFQNLKDLAAEIPILGGLSEEAMLGIQQKGDPSGWALEVKKESQQMTIATPFDNVREANLELYGKVIWPALKNSDITMRIRKQQMSIEEQPNMQGLNSLPVNMPIGDLSSKEVLAFGIPESDIMDNPERRVNDFSMMNVDFVLDEEKLTSTERQRILAYLGNLQKAGIPIPPLVIFEFMDEPVRDKILAVLKQSAAPPQSPGPGAPPQGPPVKQAPPPPQGQQPGPG